MSFILASESPRRLELLAQIGLVPEAVIPAQIDETPFEGEKPRSYVERMACEKAAAIDHKLPILAADTSVILGRKILGKPKDKDHARSMLQSLMGRRHQVVSAVCLRQGEKFFCRISETKIRLCQLSAQELEAYLDSLEWQGKAGSYAIQGRAGAFITWMSGSYSNVVGLPLSDVRVLMERLK